MVQAGSVLGFGVFGLVVVAERVEAGEAVVEVESAVGQAVLCAGCGVRARSKGRRRVVLRDAPLAGGMPVRVLWSKRFWACADSGCGARTWTEQTGLAAARLDDAIECCRAPEAAPELHTLARTLTRWRTETQMLPTLVVRVYLVTESGFSTEWARVGA